jgi:hypothetical protein
MTYSTDNKGLNMKPDLVETDFNRAFQGLMNISFLPPKYQWVHMGALKNRTI